MTKDWETILKVSLKQRWKRHRRALKRCQRTFTEKSVHASRVETRRLLSLVELLNVFLGQRHLKKVRRILKRHMDSVDSVRDTQVQLLLLGKHARQFPETRPFRQKLEKREARSLKAAARRIKRVKIGPLQKILRRLGRQLGRVRRDATQSSRHRTAVLNAANEAYAKTLALQRAMDPGAAETIHRTRIAFKKFRYMVEALQPLFPGITRSRLAAMQEFQTMMGDVRDSQVFLACLDKHTRGHEARARRLARFRRWLLVQHTGQISHCLEHADRLHDFWPLPGGKLGRPAPAGRSNRVKR